jgi:hypothetical protein
LSRQGGVDPLLAHISSCNVRTAMTTWRYEFIATGQPYSDMLVLDGGNFRADDISAARRVLTAVIRNIKVSGPTKPNAIRLLDPLGQEAWRAKLQHL